MDSQPPTLPAGRMLRLDRTRIEITDGNLCQPLRLNWADLGAVLDSGRVTTDLIRCCEQAVIAWRDHPGGFRGAGWTDVVAAAPGPERPFGRPVDRPTLASNSTCSPVPGSNTATAVGQG
ncbi:hypothetical protein MCAG_02616 [Micromonospora sp. ATCC 39149]|nr:hypothetical protein MCAG_02616 [Micromonospora sp. ATCC 39149]